MSLSKATHPNGDAIRLPGQSPYPATDLISLVEVPFQLPCDDPWIEGDDATAHAYLKGALNGWAEHPDWMDFLDSDSPAYDLKKLERDLYLHWWPDLLKAERVLDIGCGIGRMTIPLLDRGLTVFGVDGDLQSLQRCAWHAAGRAGHLDLFWSSVHRLPTIPEVDAIIACEVYCYVPEVLTAIQQATQRLRRGGKFFLSVEGRWGWAVAEDAPIGGIEEALNGTGTLDCPGDRWVQTYTESDLRRLLEAAGLEVELLVPTHYLTDGPLERSLPESLSLGEVLDFEARCREHPIWGPLNRAWTVVARRP